MNNGTLFTFIMVAAFLIASVAAMIIANGGHYDGVYSGIVIERSDGSIIMWDPELRVPVVINSLDDIRETFRWFEAEK